MNLRKSTLSAISFVLVSCLAQPAVASPLVSIGDNADVFFNGSSSLRWSSNIFRDEDDKENDLIMSLTPGFEVNLGRGASNADLSLVTLYEMRRYVDFDELDTNLFSVQADGSYRSSRLDVSGSVYFREQKRSTGDVNLDNEQIESYGLGGQVNGEYRVSPKFSFGAGFKYRETVYKDPFDFVFADRESFDIPVDVFYELTPKVDLSIGYSYGERESKGTPSGSVAFTTEHHFFNVGARGNLLPKLSGFFKIGYRTSDSSRAGSSARSSLGLDADLTWSATPKLTNRLGVSRDFGVGGVGLSTENTTISVSSNYSINSFFAASAFIDYTLREYQNIEREEDQYRLGARLTYTPNQYWNFGAGYTYSENDSNSQNRSYEDHTIDFTASLRY